MSSLLVELGLPFVRSICVHVGAELQRVPSRGLDDRVDERLPVGAEAALQDGALVPSPTYPHDAGLFGRKRLRLDSRLTGLDVQVRALDPGYNYYEMDYENFQKLFFSDHPVRFANLPGCTVQA